jgi:hypothetical protein
MRIRVSDPAQLEDLRCALREGGVASSRIEPDILTVLDPSASDEDLRVEITFFVSAWRTYRDVDVHLAA